jgi:hypothetical protein
VFANILVCPRLCYCRKNINPHQECDLQTKYHMLVHSIGNYINIFVSNVILMNTLCKWIIQSSVMWRRVTFVRSKVSEDRVAYIFRVTRIGELGTSAVTSNWSTLRRNTNYKKKGALSFEISVLTRVTRRHIPEDGILHSRRRENLKSYTALTGLSL